MTQVETPRGRLEIRELRGLDDMAAAEAIQVQVWGPISPTPKEILIPIQHEGGLLAGAFLPGGELVSFVFCFPTRDPAAMHSHMLATLPAWRGLGIGTRMKWFQRQWCLERGVTGLRWTVDPLRAANAAVNIHHLGATACAYYPDYYGAMQGIDAGVPTDRLLVVWALGSPRVARRAEVTPEDHGFPDAVPVNDPTAASLAGQPTQASLTLDGPRLLVYLPEDYIRLAQAAPDMALAWRSQTRSLLQHYFAQGYRITEFTHIPSPAYLLEKGAGDEY